MRSAGFPADGLDVFAAPACARVADAYLDGRASEEELNAAHAEASAAASAAARAIASDPLFREAITWQNPSVAAILDHLTRDEPPAATGKEARRRRQKRRFREDTVARYWQRYCGKNDTIGFFGPVAWGELDPPPPPYGRGRARRSRDPARSSMRSGRSRRTSRI